MDTVFAGTGAFQNQSRAIDRVWRAMDDEQKLVGFQSYFILDDAILRNANADEACPERTDSADNHSSLKTRDNPANERTSYEDRPDSRYGECSGPKQQSSESTPERSHFAPILHAIAGIVVANDMFIRVRILRGNRKALHIDACLLQFFDRVFGLLVGVIDRYHRICRDHCVLHLSELTANTFGAVLDGH